MKNILIVFAILVIFYNPLLSHNNIGTNNESYKEIYKQKFVSGIKPLISVTFKSGTWFSYDGINFTKSEKNTLSTIPTIRFAFKHSEYISYDNGTNWIQTKTASTNTHNILKSKLNIFPNPASTMLTVSYESDIFVDSADIYIENLIGERILVWKGGLKPGNNEMTIDTRTFATGSYLLILNGFNFLQSKQIRIIK